MGNDEVRSGRRRRFSAADRERLVVAWRCSGLSQNRFARKHGIDASYLSRWKVEFPEGGLATAATGLVPVRVVDGPSPARRPSTFDLRLPSGVEVAVPADFERAALVLLLEVLGSHGVARC